MRSRRSTVAESIFSPMDIREESSTISPKVMNSACRSDLRVEKGLVAASKLFPSSTWMIAYMLYRPIVAYIYIYLVRQSAENAKQANDKVIFFFILLPFVLPP